MDRSKALDAVKNYLVAHGGHTVKRFVQGIGQPMEELPLGVSFGRGGPTLVPDELLDLVLEEAFKPKLAPYDDEMANWLADCMGAVEATSEEQHQLWAANDRRKDTGGLAPRVWISEGMGYGPCVGHFGGMPVHVSLRRAQVAGVWLVFYHATSLVVHHDLVRDWLKAHLPKAAAENMVDATNFYNVFPRS